MTDEVRVSFKLRKVHLDSVKRAAALAGVPYQTWIKMAIWRQAVADLRAAASVAEAPSIEAREQARTNAETEWEVASVSGELTNPGPGWEPFAAGDTWILWRRRKQK